MRFIYIQRIVHISSVLSIKYETTSGNYLYTNFNFTTSLLDRVLLIPVPKGNKLLKTSDDETWTSNFEKLLPGVSGIVGHVIHIGQWITTQDGINFRRECREIVRGAFGEMEDGSRMCKMWSAGLFVVRKVITGFSST